MTQTSVSEEQLELPLEITQERLKELFEYVPGYLLWRDSGEAYRVAREILFPGAYKEA